MEGSETENENEGRIALWPVRNREGREGQNDPPYLTGKLTIEGRKFLITLWKRDRTSDRQPTLSGHVTEEKELEV